MAWYPCITRPADPAVHPAELVVVEDFPTTRDETLVYRFYDDRGDGLLLYVGITGQPVVRWMAHRRLAEWWPFITALETEMCRDRGDALWLEREIIVGERPPYNRAGNPDWAAR